MSDLSEPSSTEYRGERLEFLTILGLAPPVTEEDVKQAYLVKARTAHPDQGGDVEQFKRLQEAFEQATEYARFKSSRMQWLSRWVEQYAEQDKLVERIKELGGTVDVKASDPLTRSIGPDFAVVLDKVIGITLSGPKIDDAVIDELLGQKRMLAGLHRLALHDTGVTVAGMLKLRTLENLRELDFAGTEVDPAVLDPMLKELGRLEKLNLDRTGIGWPARVKLRVRYRNLTIT